MAASGAASTNAWPTPSTASTANNSSGKGAGNGRPFADICVVAHVDDDTGRLVAELPDGVRLPQAVLEELSCYAKFTGVVYDRVGKPIWRAHSVRTATEAQRQILIARYGGCFHCGANPAMCQIHHIKPVSQGGATKIENMVPICWDCHNRIHHHHWQIRTSPDRVHTPAPARAGPLRARARPRAAHTAPARADARTRPAVARTSQLAGWTRRGAGRAASSQSRAQRDPARACSRSAGCGWSAPPGMEMHNGTPPERTTRFY